MHRHRDSTNHEHQQLDATCNPGLSNPVLGTERKRHLMAQILLKISFCKEVHPPPVKQFGDLDYASPEAGNAKGAGRERKGIPARKALSQLRMVCSICVLASLSLCVLPMCCALQRFKRASSHLYFLWLRSHHPFVSACCWSPCRSGIAMLNAPGRGISPNPQCLFHSLGCSTTICCKLNTLVEK